jgi:hypothetical protein
MRRKKYNFQVGDSVYTTKNSSWGRVTMTIRKKDNTGAVCWNPEFGITGWFHFSELCHANSDRAKQLKLLAEMEKKVGQLKHQLFS